MTKILPSLLIFICTMHFSQNNSGKNEAKTNISNKQLSSAPDTVETTSTTHRQSTSSSNKSNQPYVYSPGASILVPDKPDYPREGTVPKGGVEWYDDYSVPVDSNKELQNIKKIKNSADYKKWVLMFTSNINKAKILRSNAEKIQNKYVYKNRWGERFFNKNNFSQTDLRNYLKIRDNLSIILKTLSNNYNREFETIYYSTVPDIKAIDWFSISQFYENAF